MTGSAEVWPLLNYEDQPDSELVAQARQKIAELPLEAAAEAGFIRDRRKYFLNIAYPSMQAMSPVSAESIPTPENRGDGKDVALYIHVPFCSAECYYCHYYKEFRQGNDKVEAFLEAASQELNLHHQKLGPLRAKSIYVGGGTPSYLSPSQIDKLFDAIGANATIDPAAEISFEMHPESIDYDRLAVLRSNGVNRLNIGVESFNDELLAGENRRHTAAQAIGAISNARAAGFDNVNIDLIYGLKDQTLAMWEQTLDVVSALEPASATMYYLRLKQKTPEYALYKKSFDRFPSEADVLLMHVMNFERMEGQLGYLQQPVDWFIRNPQYFHQYQDHNWRRSDDTALLGIGPSAYSYINGWQYYNVNHLGRYIDQVAQQEIPAWRGEFLEGEEKMRRTIMLGMKMGMDRAVFNQTYGLDVVAAFPQEWSRLEELGLVNINPNAVELTYMGKLLADEVGQAFYSTQMRERMAQIDPDLISTTWPMINK